MYTKTITRNVYEWNDLTPKEMKWIENETNNYIESQKEVFSSMLSQDVLIQNVLDYLSDFWGEALNDKSREWDISKDDLLTMIHHVVTKKKNKKELIFD